MHLRILALTTSTLLLAACGGNDTPIISCTKDEFNSVDAELVLPESLAAHSELRVALVSKEGNRNIAQDGAKLSCIRDIKECQGSIATEKARPGLYTLTAYDAKGLPVGSTAVEIKKTSTEEAGCSAKLAATINTEFKAYVLNLPLSGTLGEALQHRMGANFWTGQADGIVMLSADELDKLSQAQQMQLKDVIGAGQYVIVTKVMQPQIEKAGKMLGTGTPITLQKEQPYLDFIAFGSNTKAATDGFGMMPVAGGTSVGEGWQPLGIEPDSQKAIRVNEFINWIKTRRDDKSTQPKLSSATPSSSSSGYVSIDQMAASYAWTTQYSVAYDTGTCDSALLGPCYNNYQVSANFWPVYVSSYNNDITDYFIVTLGSNLAAQGCYGWYRNKGKSHEDRIAAYWAQHYFYEAKIYKSTANGGSFWAYSDLQVNSNYEPNTTASTVDVTTGVNWSLTGTGSIGATSSGPTGSVGFSAGVTFTNSSKQTYTAMAATSNVASSAQSNPSLAKWDYDSKNYVKNSVMPHDNGCAGSDFNFTAIDSTDVSATFSPQATFLWQATKNVREQMANEQGANPYGSDKITINAEIDLGVLLGWAYWPDDIGQCSGAEFNCPENGYYELDAGGCAGKNKNSSGMTSLIYDVGCSYDTEWGTMPLGPDNKSAGDGNPGQPKILNSPTLNVPFAYASAAPK